MRVERRAAGAIEGVGLARGKELGHFAKGRGVLVEEGRERRGPGLRGDHRRGRVRLGHRTAERIGEAGIKLAALRQKVERLRLVEAPHLDRPLDHRTLAVERKPPVRLARDRNHAAVDVRRERPVDGKLGLASGLAFLQGRIVEERKAHGALDLERPIARQEHRRRMRVDPANRRAMGCGVRQKGQHLVLRGDELVHWQA